MALKYILCVASYFLVFAAPFGAAWGQVLSDSVRQAVERAEKAMLPKEVLSKIKPIVTPYKIVSTQTDLVEERNKLHEKEEVSSVVVRQSSKEEVGQEIVSSELEEAIKAFSMPEQKVQTRIIKPKQVSFVLSSYLVDLETGEKASMQKTSFVPEYSDKIEVDSEKFLLGSESASLRGTILGIEHLPTRVDLFLDKEKILFTVPLIKRNTLPVSKSGTYVFLKLIGVETVDLAETYEERIFYDEDFKVSKVPSRYVLFSGVNPGNILVYSEKEKKYAEKVVAVAPGELYYDELEISDSSLFSFSLTQRNIFGSSSQDLNIEGEKIRYFNTVNTANKIGPGLYEIKRPYMLSNMKTYLDFGVISKDLKMALVGSLDEGNALEIPSLDFMKGIIAQFETLREGSDCLIQVNLKSGIKNFELGYVSANREMDPAMIFLSRSGEFSRSAGVDDKYVFIHGREQGLVSIKIEYEKDVQDFFKTYCSPQVYIVEQI